MIRSLLRQGLRLLAPAALGAAMLFAAPAQSAPLTINDNGACLSWSLSGNTLTCNPGSSTTLVCNPSATPATQLISTNSTIAANCAGASGAATYVWTAAAANGASCPAVPIAAAASPGLASFPLSSASATAGCTYSLTATDGSKTVTVNGSATVTWVTTLPFTCGFSPTPGTATVGTPLPLTVTCQNPSSPLSVTWSASGGGASFSSAGATTGSNNVTFTSAGTWTITANVTSGTNSASPTAIVTANPAGVTNLCAAQGYAKTIYYKWDWTNPSALAQLDTLYTQDMAGNPGGLGTNGILVVEFTPTLPANTGTGTTPYPYMSTVQVTPYPGNSSAPAFTLAISTTPCDLNPPSPATATGSSVNMPYGIGPVPMSGIGVPHPTAASLTPGVTYYINVAGRSNVATTTTYGQGTPNCNPAPGKVCDARLAIYKPPLH